MPHDSDRTAIVIPARMDSTRLPGKPLRRLAGGRFLLDEVVTQARQVTAYVAVTSPDAVVESHCRVRRYAFVRTTGFAPDGGQKYPTGTHRAAAVQEYAGWKNIITIINWQVDEPNVPPSWVANLARLMQEENWEIGTLVAPVLDRREFLASPARVKARVRDGKCLGFSRAEGELEHVGIYAFRPDALICLGKLPPSEKSVAESLEQLAWLEAGWEIHAVDTGGPAPRAINSEEDLL